MSGTAIILTCAIGVVTSFTGSMGAFVLWVHFGLDEHWQARKEHNRLKDIQRGLELENEHRLRHGLPPVGLGSTTTTVRESPLRFERKG